MDAAVPKLGILSLVENSIVHGMKNTADAITIRITWASEGTGCCSGFQTTDVGSIRSTWEESGGRWPILRWCLRRASGSSI